MTATQNLQQSGGNDWMTADWHSLSVHRALVKSCVRASLPEVARDILPLGCELHVIGKEMVYP